MKSESGHNHKNHNSSALSPYYRNLIMYESRLRSLVRRQVSGERRNEVSSMRLKELYDVFYKLEMNERYPLLDYVIRMVLDDDLSKEAKNRLMNCCSAASFTPNEL